MPTFQRYTLYSKRSSAECSGQYLVAPLPHATADRNAAESKHIHHRRNIIQTTTPSGGE